MKKVKFKKYSDLYYLFILFFIIIISVYLVLGHIEKNETYQIKENLESILRITHDNINRWKKHRIYKIEIIASSHEIKSLTQTLIKTSRQSKIYKSAVDKIQVYLQPKLNELNDDNYYILSPTLVNLASFDTGTIGKEYFNKEKLEKIHNIFTGNSILTTPYFSKFSKKAEMILGTPIKDNSGNIIAALLFLVPPENEFTQILQLGKVAMTGETYAFDRNGKLISESRFNNQLRKIGLIKENEKGILNIKIEDPGYNLLENSEKSHEGSVKSFTKMVKSALSEKSGINLEGYRDYRGVMVVGTWLWDNYLNMGIATEVDKSEIYRHSYETYFLITALVCIITLLSLLYGNRLKKSLKNLDILRHKLEKNNEELEKANYELSQYASVVSHDLKTPLRAIHSYSDFLMEDLIDSLEEEQKNYLLGLGKAVKQSEALVNDMLDYYRLGKLNVKINNINVNTFLDELKTMIHPSEKEKIIFETDIQTLNSEIVLLRHILQNLISNGFKYNQSNEKIVEVKIINYDENNIRITVSDNGIGIEPEYHEKIFGIFQRLHPSDEYEGTGIGLAVVKKAIDKLGGNIKLESKINEGAKFIIILPKNESKG
ncbi:MAG: ATP-binding protein [Spirochaetia bacterium]|nr:ATP-binding protein [Spirochaetia bacterium]